MDATKKQQMIKSACWVNALLGLWLVIAPFVLNYRHLETAMWNSIATGVVVGLLALARATGIIKKAKQAEFLNVLFGAWLIVSAFALGFSNELRLLWNNVIVGIAIGALALSDALGASRASPTTTATR